MTEEELKLFSEFLEQREYAGPLIPTLRPQGRAVTPSPMNFQKSTQSPVNLRQSSAKMDPHGLQRTANLRSSFAGNTGRSTSGKNLGNNDNLRLAFSQKTGTPLPKSASYLTKYLK